MRYRLTVDSGAYVTIPGTHSGLDSTGSAYVQ